MTRVNPEVNDMGDIPTNPELVAHGYYTTDFWEKLYVAFKSRLMQETNLKPDGEQ